MSDDDMEEDFERVEFKVKSGTHFNDMFKQEECLKNTLILDIRENQRFKTEHVKHSFNIPNWGSNEKQRCATKSHVIEYFLDNLSSHIVNINLPGHYDDIIVYDEDSNDKHVSEWLVFMLDTIKKWNEGTATCICFLNGGFQVIKNAFPHLLTSTPDTGLLTPPNNFPPIITNFSSNPYVWPRPNKAAEILLIHHFYIKNLDDAIQKTVEKIELQRKFRILEKIMVQLKEDQCEILKRVFDCYKDGSLNCDSCKQMLNDIIHQCDGGHGICQYCSEQPIVYPSGEHGLFHDENKERCPHGVKLISLTLRRLIATASAISCRHDSIKRILNQASDNAVDSSRHKVAVITRVEGEMESIKQHMKVLTQELRDIKNEVVQHECEWLQVNEEDDTLSVTRGFLEQLFLEKTIFNTVQMTLELETVAKDCTYY